MMDTAVMVQVVVIHIPAHNIPIDLDGPVIIVNVDIRYANVRSAMSDPAVSLPAMIVYAVIMPVAIIDQPDPDRKPHSKRNNVGRVDIPEIGSGMGIYDIRVIGRDIDNLGLNRNNSNIVPLYDYLLLSIRDEIA